MLPADVAGVHDVVDRREDIRDVRSDEAVSVGDDADAITCHPEPRKTAKDSPSRAAPDPSPSARLRMTRMTSDDARANFEYFSNEYAQALQAFEAIEKQASTLMLMGYTGDLRQFLEQFL